MLLSDVCLSVAYIGPKSRTERPTKTKIGTGIAHVTRDSAPLSRSKSQRPRSPGRFTHRGLNASSRQLQRSTWERIRRGKLLLRCGVLGGARRFGAHRGRRGAGHIVAAARLQLVRCTIIYTACKILLWPMLAQTAL